MTPRIGSLFSGAGGLDLAVEHVTGGRTVWHCEADPDASKVLAAHWPDVPNLGDITAVDWSQVEPVDILCGGFPCQDVSAAGRRAGIASGTRSGLWLEYAEAINQLRPQLVVIENVRGLLSGYAHRAMEPGPDDLGDRSGRPLLRAAGAVLGDLADLGYDAQWTTVAASEVGAPHRRERVFIVAYPQGKPWSLDQRDLRRAATDTDNATLHGQRSRQEPWRRGESPTAHPEGHGWNQGWAESTRFVGRSDVALGGDEVDRLDLLPTPSVADGMGGHLSRSGARSGELLLPGVAKAYAEGALLPTPAASDGARGPDYARVDREASGGDDLITTVFRAMNDSQWGKYGPAIRRWESITREAPAPTELGSKGGPRLAAPFSEWMQGWPLGWVTSVAISRSAMLRIIGNGVVPQQAVAALYWLLSVCEVAA